jgi:hypothetical protein
MNKSTILLGIVSAAVSVSILWGCKKTEVENPYATIPASAPDYTPSADDLPVGNFAWLHAKIFKPTCANSGCHDGTFEPEFRTIASSYNSLVNQPVINNNPMNSFTHRVIPFDAENSWLHERITVDVENLSGIMPLETGDSDWDENSTFYIQKITEWINDGAKDMYGNPAPSATANTPPLIYGMAVFPHNNTTTPYARDPDSPYGIGAFEVPAGLVDVWIFPFDDNAGVNQFQSITMQAGTTATNFVNPISTTFSLQSPITALDFGDSPQSFYYKATLDLTGVASGQTRYLRCYVDDGAQPTITEIPNDASQPFWYLLFSVIVQ